MLGFGDCFFLAPMDSSGVEASSRFVVGLDSDRIRKRASDFGDSR